MDLKGVRQILTIVTHIITDNGSLQKIIDSLYYWYLVYFVFLFILLFIVCLFVHIPIAPSKPTNLQLSVSKPSENTSWPRMKVTWDMPAEKNGIITKYIVTYSYIFAGVTNSTEVSTNSQIFEHTFDVLGGIEYTVSVYAETIKPGPKEEQVELVSVYSK